MKGKLHKDLSESNRGWMVRHTEVSALGSWITDFVLSPIDNSEVEKMNESVSQEGIEVEFEIMPASRFFTCRQPIPSEPKLYAQIQKK